MKTFESYFADSPDFPTIPHMEFVIVVAIYFAVNEISNQGLTTDFGNRPKSGSILFNSETLSLSFKICHIMESTFIIHCCRKSLRNPSDRSVHSLHLNFNKFIKPTRRALFDRNLHFDDIRTERLVRHIEVSLVHDVLQIFKESPSLRALPQSCILAVLSFANVRTNNNSYYKPNI